MKRKDFIKISAIMPFINVGTQLDRFFNTENTFLTTEKLPVFFIGHGNPAHSYEDNDVTRAWKKMASELITRPRSILVISAHYQSFTSSFLKVKPKFAYPEYPAMGAIKDTELLKGIHPPIIVDGDTDLDHGTWSVLRHIAPERDIPVMELSIPLAQPYGYHLELATKLAVLRQKGVLVIGSGNIVHNLRMGALKSVLLTKKPFHWAIEFDEWVKDNINKRDLLSLAGYHNLGTIAALAAPTADHYLPMLYCMAMADENEEIEHTYEQVIRSTSMRCFKIG